MWFYYKIVQELDLHSIFFFFLLQTENNVSVQKPLNLEILSVSAGVIGVVCLLLSIRLAHASLEHKLKPRRGQQNANPTFTKVSR